MTAATRPASTALDEATRTTPDGGDAPELLWRAALGDVLRGIRQDRGERLVDTARAAGVSPQYLSEVERGRKEPSSEVIAALARAHDRSLLELTLEVARTLRRHEAVRRAARSTQRRRPLARLVPAGARGGLVLALDGSTASRSVLESSAGDAPGASASRGAPAPIALALAA